MQNRSPSKTHPLGLLGLFHHKRCLRAAASAPRIVGPFSGCTTLPGFADSSISLAPLCLSLASLFTPSLGHIVERCGWSCFPSCGLAPRPTCRTVAPVAEGISAGFPPAPTLYTRRPVAPRTGSNREHSPVERGHMCRIYPGLALELCPDAVQNGTAPVREKGDDGEKERVGAPGGAWTHDARLKRAVLCHLSYRSLFVHLATGSRFTFSIRLSRKPLPFKVL